MTTVAALPTQTGNRRRAWSRGILAGPVCFLVSILVMAGASLWYPQGPAQINNIAVPIAVFPAIWAALFFYLMLDNKLGRAWVVAIVLLLVHAGVIGQHVMASMAAKKAETAAVATPAAGVAK
ncbi:MAG: hypothetical protein Q7J29_05375 [Stagnimonas sp.]|nr:hypothetical protein [Stagnimonas sp.]